MPVVKHRPLDGVQLDAAYREGKVPVIQLVYDGTVSPHVEIPLQDGFRLSAENRGIDPEIVRVECGGVFTCVTCSSFLATGSRVSKYVNGFSWTFI